MGVRNEGIRYQTLWAPVWGKGEEKETRTQKARAHSRHAVIQMVLREPQAVEAVSGQRVEWIRSKAAFGTSWHVCEQVGSKSKQLCFPNCSTGANGQS